MAIRPELGSVELAEKGLTRMDTKIPFYLADIAERSRNLTAFVRAFEIVVSSEALGRPYETTLGYLDFGVQLGTAHYVSSLGLDSDFVLRFRGETYPFVRESRQARSSRFSNVVNGALILRDVEACKVFASIDFNSVEWAGGGQMQAMFQQRLARPKWDQEDLFVLEGMIATQQDHLRYNRGSAESRQWFKDIALPCWHVYEAIFADDETEYGVRLRNAIDIHKKYWTKQGTHDWDGWLSLYLIGAATVAYDRRGWDLPVETPYIPKWMVTGETLSDEVRQQWQKFDCGDFFVKRPVPKKPFSNLSEDQKNKFRSIVNLFLPQLPSDWAALKLSFGPETSKSVYIETASTPTKANLSNEKWEQLEQHTTELVASYNYLPTEVNEYRISIEVTKNKDISIEIQQINKKLELQKYRFSYTP